MKKVIVAVLLVGCLSGYTHSQRDTIRIMDGFVTGKDYLDMDNIGKRNYAMGVIDGMLTAQMFGAPEAKTDWLSHCVPKMTDEQVAAILTKHLRENPGQWHYGMVMLSFNAMRAACPRPSSAPKP